MLTLRWETDSVNTEMENRVLTSRQSVNTEKQRENRVLILRWETDSVNTETGKREC